MRPEPENAFTSILWPRGRGHDAEGSAEKPETSARLLVDCLHDLALDQVLERLAEDAAAAREAWIHPLTTLEDVKYRHEVFAELEEPNFRSPSRP
ncbi:hypothetical protein [Brachybacterium endophyticum]|uniref:hypothetical protein n=1 Tax=Brachybacterium endophyticum TaxID=2182385 RepID=UPI0010576572|nr:hypothetical protein [Brachybacterium endophyticum]